jgi:hypothetical protein
MSRPLEQLATRLRWVRSWQPTLQSFLSTLSGPPLIISEAGCARAVASAALWPALEWRPQFLVEGGPSIPRGGRGDRGGRGGSSGDTCPLMSYSPEE